MSLQSIGEPSPPCASDDGTVAEGEDSALLPRSGRGRKEGASEGVVVDAEVWCGGGLPVPGGGECRCCPGLLG